MPEIRTETIASRPELRPTLWQCGQCTAVIAIYSAEIIEMAICPICCDVTLDRCGSFESILGIPLQARSPVAS
jgi:hypothetical protein